jgi:hypothetical protein
MRALLVETLLLFASLEPVAGQAAGPLAASETFGISVRGWNENAVLREQPDQVSMGRLLLGGGVGAGLAILATHIIYQANGGGTLCGDDPCGTYPALLTLMLAEPILVPVGVHAANHGRGSFAGTFFGSLVTLGTMFLLGNWTDMGPSVLYLTPPLQIVVSALIQRASERHRSVP